jgi:murein DD-endopeptidase MepM/ murein hydrolase activator NlpD
VKLTGQPMRWGGPARLLAVVAVFSIAVVPALAVSAQSQITQDDIAQADAHRRQVGANLEAATVKYDAAVNRLADLEDTLASLNAQLDDLQRQLAVARVAAQEVATQRYMYADSGQSAFFDAASIGDVSLRSSYLNRLSRAGSDAIDRMYGLQDNFQQQQGAVAQAVADQQATNDELEATAADIMSQLQAANDEYNSVVAAYEKQEAERRAREEAARRAREEEARRQAAAAAATTTTTTTTTAAPSPGSTDPPPGGLVCPVDGAVSFTDTWGAPRSGGRTHKGVDMIAARGTHAVAIESGKIRKMGNGGLGGITVWITGNSGDQYYYAHLDGWADGLHAGQSVTAGELIGYVGNTGNARYTVTHLHFEYHPGGGAAVNPTPLVASLCR